MKKDSERTTHGAEKTSTHVLIKTYHDAEPDDAYGILYTLSQKAVDEMAQGSTSPAFDFLIKVADELQWEKYPVLGWQSKVYEVHTALRESARQILIQKFARYFLLGNKNQGQYFDYARKLVQFFSKNPEHVKGPIGNNNIVTKFLERYMRLLYFAEALPKHEIVFACCFTTQWDLIPRGDEVSLRYFRDYTLGLLGKENLPKHGLENISHDVDNQQCTTISLALFNEGHEELSSLIFKLYISCHARS